MESESVFGEVAALIKQVTMFVLVLNFLLNLLIGSAIQNLLAAIRKLSIMLHLLIINVKIPANAMVFFSNLFAFVAFDIVEIEPFVRPLLNLQSDEVSNTNLYDLGYPSNYFVINIGNLAIGLVYFASVFIFACLTSKCESKRIGGCRRMLTNGLYWNKPLAFLNEIYIVFSISAVTNFFVFDFKSYGSTISSALTVIASLILFGYPVLILVRLIAKSDQLSDPTVKGKFGSVYSELAFKREGKKALFEPFLFCVRFLLLTFTLLMLQSQPAFQIIISLALTTFMTIFVGLANPYKLIRKTFFEQFNEFFIAVTIYHLMAIADNVEDAPARTVIGWSLIASFCFCLLVNLCSVLADLGREVYINLRRKYLRWKLKKTKKDSKEANSTLVKEQREEEEIKVPELILKHLEKERQMSAQSLGTIIYAQD